jgi:hypothetical protein
MWWFGPPWPSADERSPLCADDFQRVRTPVGRPCLYCTVEIHEDDGGIFVATLVDGPDGRRVAGRKPVHRECNLRTAIGGAGCLAAEPHEPGTCNPDGGLSRYRSALLVQKWVDEMGLENVLNAAQYKQVRDHLQREIEEALIQELLNR